MTLLVACGGALIMGLSLVPEYQRIYDEMHMHELPMPTEAALSAFKLVGRFWWLVAVAGTALIVLGACGTLDRFLGRLIGISIALIVLTWLALWTIATPIHRLQRKLQERATLTPRG